MKKTLIITLMDGRVITPDFNKIVGMLPGVQGPNGMLIGAPADHPIYIQLCQGIAVNGYIDDGASDTEMTYITPANIKSVKIKFEKPEEAKLIITE